MARRTLRIGISGSYGGLNLGDEAILEAILAQLRGTVDAHITVFSRNAEDTHQRHGVDAIRVSQLNKDEAREVVASLDLFVLGGGGILYDGGAEIYLRELKLAQEAGIATMTYAISAGPLERAESREAVRDVLSATDVVTVRDRPSQKLLEQTGVDKDITVTADPALLLEPAELPEDALEIEGVDTSRVLVGMSIREPGPAAPDLDVEHHHKVLANAADFMTERFGAHIVFIPMEPTSVDLQHSHAVVAKMENAAHATVLKRKYSAGEMLSIVGRFDLAVGMRLHFLIFAASRGVPFVALPYASKVGAFLEEMQMPTPPAAAASPGSLIACIDDRWDNRKAVAAHIHKNFAPLRERAKETNRLLLQLIETHVQGGARHAAPPA
ncbi:MAG TPA: polysaccharide pyruvyl transferase family protein [Thermoanaerobaculia bacterium]|nr:polysaccharide pyruvyl transferase family protein [Thermoanaerobaculia bacterium]